MAFRGLVAVKRAIDYSVKIRVRPDKKGVETQNVKISMNPFCEIALEEALRLKEKGVLAEVVAVSVGNEKSQDILRQALAMGADRGILINAGDVDIFPLQIAKLLAYLTRREKSDLVLLGKQSIDGDHHQTGQILAGLLGWPMATCASKVVAEGGSNYFRIDREVEIGTETVRLSLPAVITADLRLNEPRFATLPNLMKAKKKPLEILTMQAVAASDTLLDLSPQLEIVAVEEPPKRKAGVMVKSVDELLSKLRDEAKVL